jgi:hypothetical protein
MVGVLQRYRIFFIALGLVIVGLIIWLAISKQNTGRIPSRGVFVMRNALYNRCMNYS